MFDELAFVALGERVVTDAVAAGDAVAVVDQIFSGGIDGDAALKRLSFEVNGFTQHHAHLLGREISIRHQRLQRETRVNLFVDAVQHRHFTPDTIGAGGGVAKRAHADFLQRNNRAHRERGGRQATRIAADATQGLIGGGQRRRLRQVFVGRIRSKHDAPV